MLQHYHPEKISARNFTPIALSSYDTLPKDIMWVGAFQGIIPSAEVALLLNAGLEHFPHLTGTLCVNTWRVIAANRNLSIEIASCDSPIDIVSLEQLPIESLYQLFMPNEISWKEKRYLFGARIVHFPELNQTVIGVRVSHCVVDGTGFGLFLKSAILSSIGKNISTPRHDRELLMLTKDPINEITPRGYEPANDLRSAHDDTPSGTEYNTSIFTIDMNGAKSLWNTSSLIDTKIHLAAWLGAECKKVRPELKELAVWCDVRRIQDFPEDFTGNCGCFVHYPLSDSVKKMTEHWKHLTSRKGFDEIAEVFSQVQAAEKKGSPLQWKNDESILQINIVPNSIANLDFGYGKAQFGIILARNSSGIRISITPDNQHFLLEIELPKQIRKHLMHSAEQEGFVVKHWGMGKSHQIS